MSKPITKTKFMECPDAKICDATGCEHKRVHPFIRGMFFKDPVRYGCKSESPCPKCVEVKS